MTPEQLAVCWSDEVNKRASDPYLEDAAADAIELYWKKHTQFNSDLASYDYLNKCCRTKHIRIRRQLARLVPLDSAVSVVDDTRDSEKEEKFKLLRRLVNKLPPRYRQVMELICENKQPEEITKTLGITLECYYKRKRRGKKMLKEFVKSLRI